MPEGLIDLRVNRLVEPLGLGSARPFFSWRCSLSGWIQSAWRIQAFAVAPDGARTPVWDSAWVRSPHSHFARWGGEDLASRQVVEWTVSSRDADGHILRSAASVFETGLLHPEDWTARFVGIPAPVHAHDDFRPCPHLKRAFTLDTSPIGARLYITAAGVVEPWLNGKRIGEDRFTPGWTDYGKRVLTRTYDVGPLLKIGQNCLGAIIGEGWYAGAIGFENRRRVYGRQIGLLAQLEIRLSCGRVVTICTDESWRGRFGAILASDRYSGEWYDARRDLGDWCDPSWEDAGWTSCVPIAAPAGRLVATAAPPIRVTRTLEPSAIEEVDGDIRLNFAENIAGWAALDISGPPGRIVRAAFAERRKKDGTLETGTLGDARCADTVVLAGQRLQWQPRFTYRSFSAIDLTGLTQSELHSAAAIAAHTDVADVGRFRSSNEVMNRIVEMARRTLKANLYDVFTDCPQRNERLGWIGDAARFLPTACHLMDMSAFTSKWMDDIVDAQSEDGAIPPQAPSYDQPPPPYRAVNIDLTSSSPGWSDAVVLIPSILHAHYGDLDVLERAFPTIARWISWCVSSYPDLFWTPPTNDILYRDWLALDRATPPALFCTAYFAHTLAVAAETARLLGRKEAAEYLSLADKCSSVFTERFVNNDGLMPGDAQTGYALALGLRILPERVRAAVADRLINAVQRDGRITTGIHATAYILPALTALGRADLCYELFLTREHAGPASWIEKGLSTIPEHWNPFAPDGELRADWGNSLTHVALASTVEWLFACVAGLSPSAPGWSAVRFEPKPGGGLTFAEAEVVTPYGPTSIAWRVEKDTLRVDMTTPPNCESVFVWGGEARPLQQGAVSTSVPLTSP